MNIMATQQQRHHRRRLFLSVVLLSSSSSSVNNNVVVQAQQSVSGAFCGTTWSNAISSCDRPCPSGAPSQCMEGEICFAGTPCSSVVVASTNTVPSGQPTPSFQQQQSSLPLQNTTPQTTTVDNTNIVNSNNNSPLYNAVATCGNGSVGNGLCSKINECCSTFGFCGVTDSHCANRAPVNDGNYNTQPSIAAEASSSSSASIDGTCGGGSIGNGVCPNNSDCCSQYGFCGTSLEHCLGKVDSATNSNNNNLGGAAENIDASASAGGADTSQQQQQQQGSDNYNNQLISGGGGGEGVVVPPVQRPNGDITTSGSGNGVDYGGGQFGEPTIQGDGSTTSSSSTTTAAAVTPHGTNKKIIGYYAGWQWYDRNKLADPTNIDFRKMQRVNYAFFQFDTQGELYGIDRWGDPQVLFGEYSSMLGGGTQKCSYDGPNDVNCGYHEHNEGLIYRAHQAGAEVYPSVGGWTLSDNFPIVAANSAARENFAENCLKILKHYQFDGIDIDWEYPGYADHSGTPNDKENYTKLLQAIRYRLDNLSGTTGKSYGLTAALPCNPQHIDNIEVDKLANILTEFNLMSYDLFGAWDPVTGANAPLYHQGFGNEDFNVHSCVENYVELGAPRERINIGLPFYGRSFKHATGLNQTHDGNDEANWPADEGTPQYFNIYNKLPYMIQMRDNKGKTQYAYTKRDDPKLPPGGEMLPEGLVSFDDERAICDKVHYAQQNDLGGFIIWDLSGDLLENLRTPLLDITNKKLGNPSFQCCMLHSLQECETERLEEEKKQQHQDQQGSYSNSFGFDTSRWGNENIRLSGCMLTSASIASLLVIGFVSIMTMI